MSRFRTYLERMGHSKEQSPDMPQNELKPVVAGTDTNIDIVFIPRPGEQGLVGWTAKTQEGHEVIWPKDYLGHDIPNARILAYEYSEGANLGDYGSDAKHLCKKLKEIRRKDTIPHPIVLVAHSLGGIVSAKVMTDGDPSISGCIQGLAFFGTPFQGTNGRELPNILGSIVTYYGLPNNGFENEIQALKRLSDALSTSHKGVKLTSFSERSSGLVDTTAATIPGVPSHAVSAIKGEHDDICKFKSKEPWYENVIDELRKLAEVKPIENAHSRITNHGTIGNLVDGNVEGGLHSNNTGTVSYGPNNNFFHSDQPKGAETASGGKPGRGGGTRH